MSSSTARLPFDMPMNGILRFPRSDGSPKKRPTVTKENAPPGVLNYMELVPHDDKRNKDWRDKVGNFLMTLLPIDPARHVSYRIAEFPQHYALYSKPRMSGITEQRDDLYLYGSRYVNNFRSPAEFAFHALWLMMDPTLNVSNCECQWCTRTPQKELSRRLGTKVDHYSSGTDKQRSQYDASGFGEAGSDTPMASPVQDPAEEAQSKLRDNPPYRVGEMVWAHLRPPIVGESDDETLQCWPAIVLDVTTRPLWTGTSMDRQPAVKLRLLGVAYVAQVEAFDVLPYHAYALSPGLQSYMSNAKPENIVDASAFHRLSEIQVFPDSQHDQRPRQVTFDRGWPAWLKGLVASWWVRDRWSLSRTISLTAGEAVPPSLRAESRSASATPSGTHQPVAADAIWWGPEQIWVGDVVRLRRSAIVDSTILAFISNGAGGRGLFLKVKKIQARRVDNPRDVWLSGTLYETIPEQDADHSSPGSPTKIETGSGLDVSSLSSLVALPSLPDPLPDSLPDPPLGFKFKSVLSPTNTIFVSLESVAGRYYPYLLFSPVLGAIRKTNPVRPEQLMSLCGHAPGDVWPANLPPMHRERKEMWDELEEEVREFLMPRWKVGARALKAERRT
ncbi:hypothetical protein CALCODRAFT_555701 [Calocera cornea HHB12733]|uniref:Cryptic loci regulator 2 N-terminal domain-containing protein n=1 Tax=Calocera cornea HHB12733 TaxID=1353952 RepID=A0A165FKP0_9BASI|nr:hypothetical protein CALCODRAFT_555701 [Calocera cornea HHB12733]